VIRTGVNYEGRDPRFVETVLPSAEVVEVTPDTIATLRDGIPVIPRATLDELRAIGKPVTLHGIGLSIASADAMDGGYLGLVDTLMDALDVAWHSEHLGYVAVDGEHLGTMLVAPRSEETLELVCGRVAEIRARWNKPFLLEHVVNLLPDPGGDYTAAGFLNEIVRRSGCGILLDVYNLECDAHNGIADVDEFLGELNLDAVREIHVACGVEDRGLQLDVHSRAARESTLALLGRVAGMAPNVEAVIFELLGSAVPSVGYEAIAGEMQRIRAALALMRRQPSAPCPQRPAPAASALPLSEHQRAMRDLLRGTAVADDPYVREAAKSTGLQVLRDTVRGWRRYRLDRQCRLTAAMLKRRGGYDEALERANSPYIEAAANAFLDAAESCGDPLLASVAAFERAMLRDEAAETSVDWPCDPYPILGALLGGTELPEVAFVPHRTIVSNECYGYFRVE
jgi:uncharacterized protein (UPF0276 family)